VVRNKNRRHVYRDMIGKPKEIDNLDDPDVEVRIIIKRILCYLYRAL